MKIMLCARKFKPPLVGGVDVYAERLGRALQRLGHEVSIIAVDSQGNTTESMEETQRLSESGEVKSSTPLSESRRSHPGANGAITVAADEHDGMAVHRLHFDFSGRPKEAFDNAYDPEMDHVIRGILQQQQPKLFVVLNFYMVTLATVAAAKALGIPVVHIATDFLPICRRATLMQWNDGACRVGESVKTCAACFVSHHVLGRAAAALLNQLPEERLVAWGSAQDGSGLPVPLRLFNPYWKQVAIMERRLRILQPLREQIDLVLTPTQYTRQAFLENGFRPEQVHFLPFGVEPEHSLAAIRHVPAPTIRFLFIGRLQPYKGAHLLLQAFNNLSSARGAGLTIYGTADDGYEAYYSQLQAMMARNENVHFGGRIAPDDLGQAFAEADYFVLPSTWHENSPLIILDALQSKTPVIASNIGGVTDVVKDGVNGMLFPMGDAKALQHVLQQAIDRPLLIEQLRAGVNLPTIGGYAETMLQLYEEIL